MFAGLMFVLGFLAVQAGNPILIEGLRAMLPSSAGAAAVEEELPSIEAKQKERDALARAMEEFLARGGKVQQVDDNVVADPPKKPDSKYGSRPI